MVRAPSNFCHSFTLAKFLRFGKGGIVIDHFAAPLFA
jgi:hypothetical protein